MKLLELVKSAHNEQAIENLSEQFDVSPANMTTITEALVPLLSEGFSRNANSDDGMVELLHALGTGRYQRYYQDSRIFSNAHVRDDGVAILKHAVQPQDRRTELVSELETRTDLDGETIEEILPFISALTMGALDQKMRPALDDLVKKLGTAIQSPFADRNPFAALAEYISAATPDSLEDSPVENETIEETTNSTPRAQTSLFAKKLGAIMSWTTAKSA